MRILSIDHGDSRIGLALSDETGLIARPLQIVKHTSRRSDAETIAAIAVEQRVERIVIGLPTDDDGRVGHQARKVQRWADALRSATKIRIEFWDESFSSKDAAGTGKKKRRGEPDDARAAAVILQGYLDARASDPHPPAPSP
jgi:putative Holliday junction resolvase